MKKKISLMAVIAITGVMLVSCKKNTIQENNIKSDTEEVAQKNVETSLVPNVILESVCYKKGRYFFTLDPLTHSFYSTLYFHFFDPVTGNVVKVKPNSSLANPRIVFFTTFGVNYKVVAATDSLVSLTYGAGCTYTSYVPEDPGTGPNISQLFCDIQKCDIETKEE